MEPERPDIALGLIVAPHGLRGEVRVQSWSDVPDRFVPGLRVYVYPGPGWMVVEEARPYRPGQWLMRLRGIADRTAAEKLRGAQLLIRRRDRAPLPPGTYYTLDLLGWPVFTPDGTLVGHLRDVQRLPAHDEFEIELVQGGRALVPAVRALVRIEEEQRRLVVEPLPGLLEPEPSSIPGRVSRRQIRRQRKLEARRRQALQAQQARLQRAQAQAQAKPSQESAQQER